MSKPSVLSLKLRYQIAGFLFMLFATVVLIMGYFNANILSDQLRRFTLYQAKTNAQNVYRLLDRMIPEDETDIKEFISTGVEFREFHRYLGTYDAIRNVVIYDEKGQQDFSWLEKDSVKVNNLKYVKEVISEKEVKSVTWAVDLYNNYGEPIESYGILEPRRLIDDHFFPIIRKGKVLCVVKVSVRLKKTSDLIKFFFTGNIAISLIFIITAFIAIYIWSEHAINRPIRNLIQAQERLSHGDFDAHVDMDVPDNNELKIIANSFNAMARELKGYRDELGEKTRKLEQANDKYRQLNETLEEEVEHKTLEQREFFSLITHDLKIPLAAIKGYTSLLMKEKTGPLNDKQKKFIQSIETSCIHLLGMVRNMLDSVKYEAGRVEYYFEKFDLTEAVKEVEQHIHPMIEEKNIHYMVDIPEECRLVYGDRGKIVQVMVNILSNAINYTPYDGEISLTAGENNGLAEIRIRDSGVGISADQLPNIFNKFQQIPGKESPSTSLGLGLYIVRRIIEGHGMKVWAESTEGKGSSFYFSLGTSSPEGSQEYVENEDLS